MFWIAVLLLALIGLVAAGALISADAVSQEQQRRVERWMAEPVVDDDDTLPMEVVR